MSTIDSITKIEDYIERMIELGHTHYFTTEHGYQGSPFKTLNIIEKYNKDLSEDRKIKMVMGCEAYFVEDANEKDRSNYHIVLVALNNKGVEQINFLMTQANKNGFYYKPRIDFRMIEKIINPKDVVVTSACVAGIGALWNDKSEEFIRWFKDYFKEHFFLEIQAHTNDKQVKHNEFIKTMANKYGINLIHANDSHYIHPEDLEYRDLFLKGKGIYYPEEEGFILDFPNVKTILNRYEEQGVFSKSEIIKALKNTLIFNKCEEITIYNKEIKMPKISNNPNKELKTLMNETWLEEKKKSDVIGRNNEYLKAIRDEVEIVEKTNMEEYFLLTNKITEHARSKYGCYVTKTGRGSAPSFYINKLLKLTDIDRLKSPVTLYPTRFMSISRILDSRSLPDIDINTSNQSALIKASEDIIGKDNCGWLIVYKTLQISSSFRLYCKSKGYEHNDYNEFAKYIKDLEKREDWKKIEEEEENPEWGDALVDSKRFVGVIEGLSPSPCSMILGTEPIDKHLGYVRLKNDKEGNPIYCCNLDGADCDKYKYLKNDYLAVTVLKIIEDTCKLAGINIPTVEELDKMLDEKTFKIYENGLTCTINQADSDYATELVSRYKPKNVSELCAFVAAIRPGFKSLLENFIQRKPYTTGVQELDNILKDSFHYMMYQESIMKYLIWLGVDEADSYTILKKISKKTLNGTELEKLKKKLHEGWIREVGKEEGFEETWQVVEDSAKYSFNSSHSLCYAYDSLYGAYLKSHYPLEYYSVALNIYEEDITRTAKLTNELKYFGIKLEKAKFRYSKSEYFFDRETNTIYKGIKSIKYLNQKSGEFLYSLRNKDLTFFDLLSEVEGTLDKRQMEVLIKLDFFSEFGKIKYLLRYYEIYKKYFKSKQIKKNDCGIKLSILKECSTKETTSLFKEINNKKLISMIMETYPNKDISDLEKVQNEFEYTGLVTPIESFDKAIYIIDEVESYKVSLVNISDGKRSTLRTNGNIKGIVSRGNSNFIKINRIERKPRNIKINGEWVKSRTEYNYWLSSFESVS